MDLNDFFASHSNISEFDETDSSLHQSILKLISKPMKLLGLELAYERTPSFNALLKAQGVAFKTIVSKRKNLLTGLFSVSSSPRYLDGRMVHAGYLGDFRIENDLKIAAFWRKHYGLTLNLFRQETTLNKPDVFITAILQDNKLAQKTLVENPRRHGDFKYHFLRSVDMVNILSRPLFKMGAPKNRYTVRYVKATEESRLLDFIDQHEQKKPLGFNFKENQGQLWKQRMNFFPQFSPTRFLVVEDDQGLWAAVTLSASPDAFKRMTLKRMARPIKILFSGLRFMGLNLPDEGQTIKTLYLTHLNIAETADPKSAITAILDFLGKNGIAKDYHMISFANWWNYSWTEYVTYSATVNLYEVTSSTHEPLLVAKGDLTTRPLGFEMVLV